MTTTDATYRKEICYDRETRDFAMYLDGELIGFARTYHEGEVTLDQLVFELTSAGLTATATQLDGGADADAMAADVTALVMRADEPAQQAACVAEPRAPICETCNGERRIPAGGWGDQAGGWAETCPDCGGHPPRQRCILCGGDHSAADCPRIHPIDATALLTEADAVLLQHPGPGCRCDDCTRRTNILIIDAYITRLQVDAGLICSFCGDPHADSACPQKRPLLVPRVCGNCGGRHSIQQCPELRAALLAA